VRGVLSGEAGVEGAEGGVEFPPYGHPFCGGEVGVLE